MNFNRRDPLATLDMKPLPKEPDEDKKKKSKTPKREL